MTHRRITGGAVAQGETARIAAAIAGEQRHGVIEGVEVDFRHPDLPAGEWEARPFWYVWGPPPINAGIIFPSEAAFGVDELRKVKNETENLAPVFVYPGDKLMVDHVIPEIKDRRFDHAHDARQLRAYLKIERPSGEVVSLPEPLAFFGKTQIRDGALRETFDHVVDRICRAANVADLYERQPQEHSPGFGFTQFWDLSLEDMALVAAHDAHDSYFRLLAAHLPEEEGLSRAHLRSLANSAVLAGFLLGKVEARKAEKIGKGVMGNLAKATAARTNTAWRDKAASLWDENPMWTTHRVANAIVKGSDDELSSVQRAIKSLAPPTSPSFKKGDRP